MVYADRPEYPELPRVANIDEAWNLAWLSHPMEVTRVRRGFWRAIANTLDEQIGGRLVWDWMGGPAKSFAEALKLESVYGVSGLAIVQFSGIGGANWSRIVTSRAHRAAPLPQCEGNIDDLREAREQIRRFYGADDHHGGTK